MEGLNNSPTDMEGWLHFGVFQNGFFSLPAFGALRGFFFDIYCSHLIKVLKEKSPKIVGAPYDWNPLEFLKILTWLHWAYSNVLITVQIVPSQHWLTVLGSCNFIFSPCFLIIGSSLYCVFTVLEIQKELLIFKFSQFLLITLIQYN